MVKILWPVLLFASSYTYGIDGIVTALEAPIFGEPNDKSKVIQYVRKGSKIFIHDAEAAVDEYEVLKYTTDPKQFEIKNNDTFITDETIYKPTKDGLFYKTISKSGREAYILKEHVFIEYKDRRELSQKVMRPDNTDYRIEEPLGKDYPLVTEISGYRGQLALGLGQPNYKAYPYKQKILDTSFSLVKEFSFTYSKVADFNYDQRLYFGYVGGMHFSDQEYLLTSQRARQENVRLYLGPYLSYDVFRNDKVYVTTYTSIHFIFFDTMEIKMNDVNTGASDSRVYQNTFNISPNLGTNLNFPKSFFNFDSLIGFNIRGLLPRTYRANTAGSESDFWRSNNVEDEFDQPFRVELSYFFGVQSNY